MIDGIGFGHAPRARHACDPHNSRGRLIPEPESPTRTAFQRDRDRIIHSTAFRRLKHKTQVFLSQDGDHYRTRLTHSIEVGQIARGIARALRVDEDLTEAIALVHDFGHTPFGHAGERALDGAMREFGGFDHNAQSLRIVTELEQCYAAFDGLNLTFETLEGLVKHNGPLTGSAVPAQIREFDATYPLDLGLHASLEAQCAAIADDIAYNAHDIDDGLRSGLITLDMLDDAPITGAIRREVLEAHGDLDGHRAPYEIVRRQITIMVEDVIRNAITNLNEFKPENVDDVRACGRQIVGFSESLARDAAGLKAFLFRTLYRNPEVMAKMSAAETVVADLFKAFSTEPGHLPEDWRLRHMRADGGNRARVIADFIAGMTDSYALRMHARLFDRTPDFG